MRRRRSPLVTAVIGDSILVATAGSVWFANSNTAGTSPHTTGTQAPVPSAAVASGLRSVHSPGTVAPDLDLQPGQCHVRVIDGKSGPVLPDPACTPGAIDPAVTQGNVKTTICAKGYTATVRPPASNTGRFKHQSLLEYGMAYSPVVEYDHKVPLELGGANSVSNLGVATEFARNPTLRVVGCARADQNGPS